MLVDVSSLDTTLAYRDDQAMVRDAIVPAAWTAFYEASNIPAAVRVGTMLRLTGHTGDRADGSFDGEVEAQIRQTFDNIANTLAECGATWADVVEINSFHVDFAGHRDAELTVAAEFLEAPYPAWSAVGVTELYEPDALYELRCVAMLPEVAIKE
jgi:enamine deaminase RidA (YjgF/YER057c/UK114 family)